MSIQPGLRSSNDLHIRRKMASFQLFFQWGRAKDLSAPLYIQASTWDKMTLPITSPNVILQEEGYFDNSTCPYA